MFRAVHKGDYSQLGYLLCNVIVCIQFEFSKISFNLNSVIWFSVIFRYFNLFLISFYHLCLFFSVSPCIPLFHTASHCFPLFPPYSYSFPLIPIFNLFLPFPTLALKLIIIIFYSFTE